MQDITVEKWDNVISSRIPNLKNISPEEFQKSFHEIKIYEYIRKINLDMSAGQSEAFLKCIPDAGEISSLRNEDPEITKMHLDAGCSSGRIAEIRIEYAENKVPRKITGYIFLDPSLIEMLLNKVSVLLEKEFYKRFRANLALPKILKEIRAKLIDIEGSFLARLFHVYESLDEIKDLLGSIDDRGKGTYHELLENKMWKTLEMQRQLRTSPSGEGANEVFRRAEDSEEWKSFARDKTFNDPIVWKQTCKALGPYFTTRILLRRENFSDILELMEMEDVCRNKNDLAKMVKDCKTVRERLAEKGKKDKIAALDQIIARIESILV